MAVRPAISFTSVVAGSSSMRTGTRCASRTQENVGLTFATIFPVGDRSRDDAEITDPYTRTVAEFARATIPRSHLSPSGIGARGFKHLREFIAKARAA